MMRVVFRAFLSPMAIALVDLVILLPLVLAIWSAGRDLGAGADIELTMTIVEGVGVMLIGWGVAIEEREALRRIFRLGPGRDPALETALNEACHASGIGILVFGLFSEIAVEMVRLPNDIIPTEGFDEVVLWVSLVFLTVGAYILAQHVVTLIRIRFLGHRPAHREMAQ